MPKSAKYSRIPTPVDLAGFKGMHCARKYELAVQTGWRCPSCRRTAEELVRWTEIRGSNWRKHYADEHGMGFTVTLTNHHCHGEGRFPRTLICGDCNSADGAAKRKLSLPGTWSFSPSELATFVSVPVHSGATSIDYEQAQRVYEQAKTVRQRAGARANASAKSIFDDQATDFHDQFLGWSRTAACDPKPTLHK